jgi:hypothetical protein
VEPVHRIRGVPIGEDEPGWVAWTPDGLGDASPEACRFVGVLPGMLGLGAIATEQGGHYQ